MLIEGEQGNPCLSLLYKIDIINLKVQYNRRWEVKP